MLYAVETQAPTTVIQYLVDKGADLSATNHLGQTALDLARDMEKDELVSILGASSPGCRM